MKKQYFKNFRKEGLPGGPNEITINSEGFILSENGQWEFPGLPTVIPSSDITMQGVPYPVLGISDTGDTQMMYPEEDYQFDGDMVYELPMAQKGYNVKPRKGSILLEGETEPSTHLMKREYIPNTGWVAFPSLFQNEDGTWVDMSKEEDWMNIYDEANRRGEVYNFGENKRKAIKFADKGSWKKDLGIKKQGGGDISIPDLTKPNWLDTLPKQYAGGGDLPPMEVNIGLPKYGKKRVLNLKDYKKQNTTSNRFPVVQNPFSRENKINLHLPENHGEEHRRLEVNPYFGGVNDEPNLNVYYGGVDADLNLLNKNNNILDLRGGLNTGLVTYPGGSEFTGVNPSVGLSYSHKFAEGGSLGDDPTKPYHPTLNPDGYKGTNPPLTFDKNDPYGQMRYKAYNDSLSLYNSTLRDEKEFGKEVGREPFTRSWEGPYEKSPGVWETKTYYDNSKIVPQYLALRSHKGTKRLNQVVDGKKVDSFDEADVALMPVYKKPTTPIELRETRTPYSPVQTNPNSTVQLPINNIPLQQMPTIGLGEPTFEGNNAYWKKQDNQLIYQNNDYSNNRNLPISNKPGDRFHQEPSWMVGDDRYYERDGEAYLVPQPKGGWKNKQILDPSSGKWKSKIVKKANGGWLDNL